MVDFGKSDKMVKISGKVDTNIDNGFNNNSFFIEDRTSSEWKLVFLKFSISSIAGL